MHLLGDPNSGVDIAFVQGGTGGGAQSDNLVSLASLYFEPLWVVSRAAPGPTDLRGLRGRRLAVGPEGSGTRAVALALLAANGVNETTAHLLLVTGLDAVQALRRGAVDTVLLVAAPGSPTVKEMFDTPGIALLSFQRADAYTKRFPFLTKLVLPAGGLSLEANRPPRDSVLLAPAAIATSSRSITFWLGGRHRMSVPSCFRSSIASRTRCARSRCPSATPMPTTICDCTSTSCVAACRSGGAPRRRERRAHSPSARASAVTRNGTPVTSRRSLRPQSRSASGVIRLPPQSRRVSDRGARARRSTIWTSWRCAALPGSRNSVT